MPGRINPIALVIDVLQVEAVNKMVTYRSMKSASEECAPNNPPARLPSAPRFPECPVSAASITAPEFCCSGGMMLVVAKSLRKGQPIRPSDSTTSPADLPVP